MKPTYFADVTIFTTPYEQFYMIKMTETPFVEMASWIFDGPMGRSMVLYTEEGYARLKTASQKLDIGFIIKDKHYEPNFRNDAWRKANGLRKPAIIS